MNFSAVETLLMRETSCPIQLRLSSQVRPFGAAVMVGSWTSSEGAQLFCIEPSGVHYGYWGCSAGKARQAAKTEIEKLKTKDMTCKELLKEAAKIIYQVFA